ncbi:MAG: hypothetical protein ACOVQA_05920 [Thermoflexibacteraceae bacterium]
MATALHPKILALKLCTTMS